MHPTLIIGATGGIGAALARRLHAAGRPLHLIGRNGAQIEALAAELAASYAVADAMDAAALAGAVQTAGGAVAGLAYCVGSIVMTPLRRASAEQYVEAFRLNAVGGALAVAAAADALRAGHGSVVLFSSVAARAGFTNHAVISAAKGAVEGLTVALAAEFAPSVRVNAIAPSLLRTRMAEALTGHEPTAKAVAAAHPINRLGEADDAAALAAFLLSPDAGWITGQILAVDGGRSTVRSKG